MKPAPLRTRLVLLCALPLLLWACSLPTDESVTQFENDQLPAGLVNTTTTTSTTTLPPTTTAPTSAPPESPPSTVTTTTNATLTAPVSLFYTDIATDGMQRVQQLLPFPVQLPTIISELESPRAGLDQRLRTSLAPGLIDTTDLSRAVLTVSLDSAVFETLTEDEKRQSIAQMVLTFTSFVVPDEGSIGAVVFQVDGTPISVFIPDQAVETSPGTPVVFDDFANLIIGTPGSPATTPPVSEPAPPTATSSPPGT
jgi:hypothetical protein